MKVRPFEVAMRGTEGCDPLRCIALAGEIGQAVACTIYDRRPSPCRQVQPAWEHGEPSPQCDRARARHGLPPLTPADFTSSSR